MLARHGSNGSNGSNGNGTKGRFAQVAAAAVAVVSVSVVDELGSSEHILEPEYECIERQLRNTS